MSTISLEGDRLVVTLDGWRQLAALRSRLEVPLAHVTGVRHDPGLTLGWFERFKLIGGYWPGQFAVGTFLDDGEVVFYDVRDAARSVVIELRDERYARLIVDAPDPDDLTRRIRARMGGPADPASAG
jgi:hypothetical protein